MLTHEREKGRTKRERQEEDREERAGQMDRETEGEKKMECDMDHEHRPTLLQVAIITRAAYQRFGVEMSGKTHQ